jgi:insertion element IS1 protein InsB
VSAVDRATRCIVRWAVVWERTGAALQETIERAIPAQQSYSAAFPTYETLVYYPGRHAVAPGKSQRYSVEADNAEVRHYLARLGRRSRCFSRSIEALRRAVKLFVHAWNRRHLHKRAFPRYACHVSDFVSH